METFIQLNEVSKEYRGKQILEDITLEIPRGACVAFVGRNGAGKSTLLRIIGGLTTPSGGELLRTPGLLYHFVPERVPRTNLSARQYICAVGAIEGLEKEIVRNRSEELFNRFHMTEMEDTPMALLSKGTLQKVGVIQAVLKRPDILLMDEPLSGQDVESQQVFIEIVNLLREEGTALVVSCHEEYLIKALGGAAYRIEEGRLYPAKAGGENREKTAVITFEDKKEKEVPVLGVPSEHIQGSLRFCVPYENSSELVIKMVSEGFLLEDFTLLAGEISLEDKQAGKKETGTSERGRTKSDRLSLRKKREKGRGRIRGILGYDFRAYFKTSRFAMPFLVLLVFLFSIYSSMPVGVTDSFVISATFLFLVMTWVGLSYQETQNPVEEQMMILRMGSEVRYYISESIFLFTLGGLFSLISLFLPLALNIINSFRMFSQPILPGDMGGGLLLMLGGAFLGESLGAALHPRIMKDRKTAVVLTVLAAVLAVAKMAVLQEFSYARYVLLVLPPIQEVTQILSKSSHFSFGRTGYAVGICMLYGGILTALRILWLKKRKF